MFSCDAILTNGFGCWLDSRRGSSREDKYITWNNLGSKGCQFYATCRFSYKLKKYFLTEEVITTTLKGMQVFFANISQYLI